MKPFYKLILNSTLVGGLAVVTVAAGCGDTNEAAVSGTAGQSTAGKGSQAGNTSVAGNTSAGGTSGGGSGGGAGGPGSAGGAGGAADEMAVGKFCNTLFRVPPVPVPVGGAGGADAGGAGGAGGAAVAGGADAGGAGGADGANDNGVPFTMVLEVGTGAQKATFKALSGTCVPMDGNACMPLPLGSGLPVVMYSEDNPGALYDGVLANFSPGQAWLFTTQLDGAGPYIDGGTLNVSVATCEDITYDDVL